MADSKWYTWEDYKRDHMTGEEIKKLEHDGELFGMLIDIRNRLHCSQQRLAELTGVKQPMIARIESGKVNVGIKTLQKLLRPLGYTLAIVKIDDPEEVIPLSTMDELM
ncbi:MAG: helix-turn-helix transcriptional regulator [Erysipelotrichaceae bacterium]|nr:helix-turn-helix transcriptional regulator [Erysipelotrichaceae bacterium]